MGKVEAFEDDDIHITNPEMIFTDRDNPRRVFWNVYDGLANDEFYVINYYGFGGIGKSRLCAYLNECIRSGKHPQTQQKIQSKSLILNFEDLKNNCDKINVLESLANKFENECGYKFPLFKYALYVYYRTQGYSNDSPEIKKLQDNVIGDMAIDILGMVPVVGGIGSVVLKGVDSFAASIKEKVVKNSAAIKQLDTMSSEDISEEIIRFFVKELMEQTRKETAPVVVFLDTYEHLQNYVYQVSSAKVSEEWLWSRTGIIRRIPNIIWVLAGQRKVDWGQYDSFWRDESNILYEEIGEIKEADRLKTMLKQIGIEEEDIVDTIVEQTRGVPIHLALCKDTYFNLKMAGITPAISDFNMEYAQLARRFIGGLSSELKDIVDILACLETWTEDDITEMNFSADAYEHIMQLSFIKKDAGTYHMHKSVQEIVYKSCSPIIQKKCMQYFEKKMSDDGVTVAEKKDYILKKIRLQEALSEGLSQEDKEEAAKQFVQDGMYYIEKYLWDYNFFSKLERLLRSGRWTQYFDVLSSKRLDVYSVYHSALNGEHIAVRSYISSGKALDNKGLDNKTKGLLFFALGSYEFENEYYKGARIYLLDAKKMLEETADLNIYLDILFKLSQACHQLEKYEEENRYCDLGLELIAKEPMNTDLIHKKCGFMIRKAKCCRVEGKYNDFLLWSGKVEETLDEYKGIGDLEQERFLQQYMLVYSEYLYYYKEIGEKEQTDKYLQLALDYNIKAYELKASDANYRDLAIRYIEVVRNTTDRERRQECLDKAIAIAWDMYHECATQKRLDTVFTYNRVGIEYMEGESATKYINACEEILANEKKFPVLWKELFNYHRSIFLRHMKFKDWDKAESKMTELEQMLSKQKDRLAEDKYLEYLSWYYEKRGYLYKYQGANYEAIFAWRKAYKLEKKRCKTDASIQKSRNYAKICRCLADVYHVVGLDEKAVEYYEEQSAVLGRLLEEYSTINILWQYWITSRELKFLYKKKHQYQKIMENCNILLKYSRRLYEAGRQDKCLYVMCQALIDKGQLWINMGQARTALQGYQEFLDLVEKKESTVVKDNMSEELDKMVDLLKCLTACLLLVQNRDLEKARAYLIAAKCHYSNFEENDREYYLAKVENRIAMRQMEKVYLTKEEGRALIQTII